MNNQPCGENDLYAYVMRMRGFSRWLTITYEVLGEKIGDECEQIDDEILEREYINERHYFEIEKPKIMSNIKKLREEMKDFAKECEQRRREELIEITENAKKKLAEMMTHYGDIKKKKAILEDVKYLERVLDSKITPDNIQRAKEYPLDRLLKIKNGMACCIDHDDSRPSMNCKNGFVYCHTCGYHGDVIDVYRKINNVGFTDAVAFLSNT